MGDPRREEAQFVAGAASVLVAGIAHRVERDIPFRFGRAEAEGIVGLGPEDMGISALAGAVELGTGFWWVVNLSRKRPLFIDLGSGPELRLDSDHRHAINASPLSVIVRGAILAHRIEVTVPASDLALRPLPARQSSGTLTGDVRLSESDRDAVVALFAGYLKTFPRRSRHPADYQQAAELLGPPWTRTTVRKRVERIRERLAGAGFYFEGPHARYDLADHLIANGIIGPQDLDRLPGEGDRR
jgi:hypothetical protein